MRVRRATVVFTVGVIVIVGAVIRRDIAALAAGAGLLGAPSVAATTQGEAEE